MCGILGEMPAQNSFLFEKALSLIAHRGPDGFGIWNEDEKISFGHRKKTSRKSNTYTKYSLFGRRKSMENANALFLGKICY